MGRVATTGIMLGLLAGCSSFGNMGSSNNGASSGSMSSQAAEHPLFPSGWVVTELGGKTPVAGSALTIAVDETGKVSGSGGCNRIGGTAAQSGSDLRFSQMISTRMACEQNLMTQESTFLRMLEETRSYKLDGTDVLVLLAADGSELTRLRRTAGAVPAAPARSDAAVVNPSIDAPVTGTSGATMPTTP
jgi:heat shock protein HslJ